MRNRTMPEIRLFVMVMAVAVCSVARSADTFTVPINAAKIMNTYCVSCHGEITQKGKVRIDTLASLRGDAKIDLLNKMQEAIRFKEMPPEDEKQPSEAERKLLDDRVGGALKQFEIGRASCRERV